VAPLGAAETEREPVVVPSPWQLNGRERAAAQVMCLRRHPGAKVSGHFPIDISLLVGPSQRGEIRELRVPLEERKLDRVGRAVPVLGENHLGEALLV
jgi:hypothetical protein